MDILFILFLHVNYERDFDLRLINTVNNMYNLIFYVFCYLRKNVAGVTTSIESFPKQSF